MPDRPVIEMRNLSFSHGGPPVLEDVNLIIRERESVCVVGPNGGGKTTLMKLVLGLLRPAEGTVRVFGGDPEQARPRIGYMPQHMGFDPLFPISVREVVLMGRLKPGWTILRGRRDREAVHAALDKMGLADKAGRSFASLSGGERQRALVARALAAEPELLILDEPAAMMDPAAEEQLLDKLRELHDRMTLITVTHDLGFVSQFVQTVVCVNRRVLLHPTSEITGEIISEIYGNDLKMVRHDHRCSEKGHSHV